jgi:ferredoxin-thioredoxin reductase catalytic subunit
VNEEELTKLMEKYAKSKGFRLNPDREVVNVIIKGLLENEKRHGYRYCPCRVLTGKKEDDAPKICPCKWHKDEIKQMGHCHCGLFFGGE